ncbi:Uncharacterised protein [Mycobacteroides abscessus]|nr:Uncharacterised protein [Mycobacteroides abscessus]
MRHASACAATVRPCDPSRNAAPSWSLRSASTSRACGYGARGSASVSSPSFQQTTSPRSTTGANAAARVPTTTRASPCKTARNAR